MDPLDQPDPDREARNEALAHVSKRLAIWAIPLAVVGALLVGLGIPLWISIVAILVVLVVLVLELDI
jgi:hypothetical protein